MNYDTSDCIQAYMSPSGKLKRMSGACGEKSCEIQPHVNGEECDQVLAVPVFASGGGN